MKRKLFQKNQIEQHSRTLWLSAFMLTVLVTVTAAWLGSTIYRYAHRSDVEIALCGEAEPMSQVKTSRGVLLQSSAGYTGAEAAEQLQTYGLHVNDADQVWSSQTAVELFHSAYQNESGATTVESEDGSRVIAPGTAGSYTFSLKNTGSKAADYKVWIEVETDTELQKLPLEARVTGRQGWLLGGTDSWQQLAALNGVAAEEHMEAGASADYTISWQWPYERGADEADTALGDQAAGQDLTCTVTIYTVAAEEPGGAGSSGGSHGNPIYGFLTSPKTGDGAKPFLWLLLLLAAAAGTGCIRIRQKSGKKKAAVSHGQKNSEDGTSE